MIISCRSKIFSLTPRSVEANRFPCPICLSILKIIRPTKNFNIYYILKVLKQAISRVLSCFNNHKNIKLCTVIIIKLWYLHKTLRMALMLILHSLGRYYILPGEYYVPKTLFRESRITSFQYR